MQYLFTFLIAVGPILLLVAQHNYAAAATGAYSLVASVLATHGVAVAGLGSLVGAWITHRKIASTATAAIPAAVQAPTSATRGKVLDLLWSDLGKQASDAEIAAFKSLREASLAQPKNTGGKS